MNKTRRPRPLTDNSPLMISGLFVIVSILWIIFSDKIVAIIAGNSAPTMSLLQTLKGGTFVAATGIMLYVLINARLSMLRASEERFKALADHSPDTITQFDAKHRHLYVNSIIENQTGIAAEKFIGKTHAELGFPEEFCAIVDQAIDKVFTSRASNNIVFQLPSGVWIDWILAPEFSETGKVVTVVAAARDITKKKDADRALEYSEFRYRALFEAAGDGVVQFNAKGIIDCNHQMSKLLGYDDKNEILGKNPAEFFPEKQPDGKSSTESMRLIIASVQKETPLSFEWNFQTRNRHIAEVIISMSLVDSASGTLVAIVHDITELRRTQGQLRQSQKMQAIGQLAGGIAHDFNNVLGGIIGYADMTLDEITGNQLATRYVENILKASDRAKHLVSQILTFSRQGLQEKYPINLKPVVNEVMELLRASLPSSITLSQHIAKDTSPVIADSTKIHETIMNLATNAVHAMDEKGELSITLREEITKEQRSGIIGSIIPGFYSILEVRDTGTGIEENLISRIFEPFFTTKNINKGTGLGLSVVYGVMESHNGNIQVESTVGQGTVFRLFFPKTMNETVTESVNHLPIPSGNERILFVDDEPALVELGNMILSSVGYEVTVLTDSRAALQLLKEHLDDFDLLITDQSMPYYTGVELATEVLKIRPGFPILLCTGFSNKVNEKSAKEMGCRDFAIKPLSKRSLTEKVRSVLDNKSSVIT
jgi:two-component system, cell cycle sensor histidine kinase and response regulator CckA